MAKHKQRGRPKGSNTTTRILLKDLNSILHPNATVMVGKLWLKEIGVNLEECDVVTVKNVKMTDDNVNVQVNDLILD